MTERTLNRVKDYQEYMNLKRAANILTTMSDKPEIYYTVEDCYLDFGSDWMWTTIIAHNAEETGVLSSWQAINPRQWKEIVACESKIELLELMKSIVK